MSTTKELVRERNDLLSGVSDFWDKHPDDNLTAAERDEVKSLQSKISELNTRIGDTQEAADLRANHAAEVKRMREPIRTVPFSTGGSGENIKTYEREDVERMTTGGSGGGLRMMSDVQELGRAFVESDEFKSWISHIAPSGAINDKIRIGDSPMVEFGSALKTLVTGASATSGGALVRRDYAPLVELPFRPLVLRDIITVGQTGSDLIEYPRVTGYTNNAAPVAEATNLSTGAKPESGLALEKVTTSVKTIAHWIPATKRALMDAGQVRTLIDNFLMFGLEDVLETQIISGDGLGENLTGILNTTGTTAQAFATDILTTARKAITKARIVGRARNIAFLLNPYDWEAYDLSKNTQGNFYFGGPMELGNPRLWGKVVVESEAVPQGTCLCGDFRQIVLWDREQSGIRVTDSHADFFIRNLVALLAEMRAAMGVFRPAAIVEFPMAA